MPLRNWQQWAYHSQFTIAAGASALCIETVVKYHLPGFRPWFFVLIFAATLIQYLIHFRALTPSINSNAERQVFFVKHSTFIKAIFTGSVSLLIISIFRVRPQVYLPLFLFGILSFSYSLLMRHQQRIGIGRLKGIFKFILLTITWTGVTTALPMFAASTPFDRLFIDRMLLQWLMMVAICLPFEIRDMENDKRNGLLNIAATIGISRTFIICYGCLFLKIILTMLWGHHQAGHWPMAIGNGIGDLLLAGSIRYAQLHLNDDRSWFLLDSNFVAHAAIVCAAVLLT